MAVGIAYAVVLGTFMAATAPLNNLVWAQYFGREFLGTIRGTIGPANMAVTSVAPLLVSFLHDAFRGYAAPLSLIVALYTASALLILPARPPQGTPPAGTPPNAGSKLP